jgi:membrane-associated phospholipid phosphatase
MAEIGLRSAEAIAISGVATELIKGMAGRDRPFLDNQDSDNFDFGGGFGGGGHTSFPSGHATAAFAIASVVASESSFRWPHASHFIQPIVYGLATSVALSRVYTDRHWASDVVAGAGIGTLTGLSVVRYHRLHPHSLLDRWFLSARVVPTGQNGVGLFVSIATH